jgi:hypothetical protein
LGIPQGCALILFSFLSFPQGSQFTVGRYFKRNYLEVTIIATGPSVSNDEVMQLANSISSKDVFRGVTQTFWKNRGMNHEFGYALIMNAESL